MNDSSAIKGLLLIALAQIMVGCNIVFSKYIIPSTSISFILAFRFITAAIILLPLHWFTDYKKQPISSYFAKLTKKDWIFIVLQALCAGVFFNFLMLWGLEYTDANVAGIITSILPVIIAIMSWLILGSRISSKKIICIVFATVGLLVLGFDRIHGANHVQHNFFGDILVFLSLLPEGIYYILSKLHTKNPLPLFIMSSLINAINGMILLIFLLFSDWNINNLNSIDWLLLCGLGLSSGLFYVFWYAGCHKVDGVMASLATAIMPLSTVLIAWVVLGEQLNIQQTIGMVIIVLSIIAYTKR